MTGVSLHPSTEGWPGPCTPLRQRKLQPNAGGAQEFATSPHLDPSTLTLADRILHPLPEVLLPSGGVGLVSRMWGNLLGRLVGAQVPVIGAVSDRVQPAGVGLTAGQVAGRVR